MDKALHRRGNTEVITLYEISKLLSSSLDLHKTLRAVLRVLSSHLHMERTMISLLEESGDLKVVVANGLSLEDLAPYRFSPGEGITGRIFKTGMPAVVPDISKEPDFLHHAAFTGMEEGATVCFIGVPIRSGHRSIGVLALIQPVQGGPVMFEAELRMLTMVANLIGQTVALHHSVADEREQLMRETHRLQKELKGRYSVDNVVGRSKRMQEVFAQVHQAAPGRSTVLLRGESGTGKEVIARAVHFLSPRHEGPFIRLNCAALPETLLESELFGHEKGAFTGATQERKGRFEQAHGGTLFLDEIGDISPAFQAKLLRVLQEREFERVGGNRTIRVDVRMITATNRNLEDMVRAGEFRADLYFRINVVTLFIPPLRERREDIPFLIDHFLSKFNKDNGARVAISPDAVRVLAGCRWPGNVRELENCVERAATMVRGDLIREADLLCQTGQCFSTSLSDYNVVGGGRGESGGCGACAPGEAPPARSEATLDEAGEPLTERDRIIAAMEKCGWVQAKAARMLDLTPRQMGYALKKYRIEVKRL